jgi:hypothetical protein
VGTSYRNEVAVQVVCTPERIEALRTIFERLGFDQDEYRDALENRLTLCKVVNEGGTTPSDWLSVLEDELRSAGVAEEFVPIHTVLENLPQ